MYKWSMPRWMVKYATSIGGENYGNKRDIEKIYNSDDPAYLIIKARIAAKIEMLHHLESIKLI